MRAYLNESEAEQSHRAGCVKLFQIVESKQVDYVRRKLPLGMMGKVMLPMMDSGKGELVVDLLRVACEGALRFPLPRNAESFAVSADYGRGELFNCADRVCSGFEKMLVSYRTLSDWIQDNGKDRHLHIVAQDLTEEIEWLLDGGFVWRAGYARMADYARYFLAMEERLKRIESLPLVKDDEKRERIAPLWKIWYEGWKLDPNNRSLWSCGWALMEWRVAEFAPSQPRKGKVSQKRIEQMVESLFS